jgi:nitrate reductase NapAB chaperone NapD
MKAVQSAVLVAMNSCLTELKKSAPQLDGLEINLENGEYVTRLAFASSIQ